MVKIYFYFQKYIEELPNKSIKILGKSIEEMQIEMEKYSDEEVIDYLYSDNIDTVILAMFEIAERQICNDKVINALIEYSKYMDEKYELYLIIK
jgi:hypothetical protein